MSSADPSPARRSRSGGQTLVGGALIAVGAVWLLNAAGISDVDWRIALPVLLGVMGLSLALGLGGRHPGALVSVGFILIALIFAGYLIQPTWNFTPTVGTVVSRPATTTQMEGAYRHGVGSLEVDLSRLTFDERAQVSASLGVGKLVVSVPEDLGLDVRAGAGMGSVVILGEEQSGIRPTLNHRSAAIEDDDVLTLDLSVGIGSVEVRR